MTDINEELLALVLEKLQGLDLKSIESIEVSSKRYVETTTLSIEIDYI